MSDKTLVDATVNGEAIVSQKQYVIATNNYIVGHIDRFFGLTESDVTIKDTGVVGRDVLLEAAEKQKVINSITDGRLVIRNQ